jgi:hypothetical protein
MNRLEWILGIMLVVLLVIVAALSLMFWFRSESQVAEPANLATEVASYAGQIEPTPSFAGQTAQLAFVAAQRTAVSWQADATLLNATATWPQGLSTQDLRTGETTWGFTFYSPTAGQTALLSVIENEASIIMKSPAQSPSHLIIPTSWNLDSVDAMDLFLQQGGTDFMASEGITALSMTLTADKGDGRIQWHIQLAATQSLRTLTMNIDATSGEILTIEKTT